MSTDILRLSSATRRIAPVEPQLAPPFCLALLVASCALASFALACATPFAAFAVLAAAMLPLSSAFLAVGTAWLVNQAIGFGLLHYPFDANAMLWGLIIGLAALAATLISSIALQALRRCATQVALAFALLGAYCTYEFVLFAATPFLGGAGDFSGAIFVRLGLLSLLWLIGLVAVCELVRQINGVRRGHAVS